LLESFASLRVSVFGLRFLELRVRVLVLFARIFLLFGVFLISGSFVRIQGQCLELSYLSAEVQLEGCVLGGLPVSYFGSF